LASLLTAAPWPALVSLVVQGGAAEADFLNDPDLHMLWHALAAHTGGDDKEAPAAGPPAAAATTAAGDASLFLFPRLQSVRLQYGTAVPSLLTLKAGARAPCCSQSPFALLSAASPQLTRLSLHHCSLHPKVMSDIVARGLGQRIQELDISETLIDLSSAGAGAAGLSQPDWLHEHVLVHLPHLCRLRLAEPLGSIRRDDGVIFKSAAVAMRLCRHGDNNSDSNSALGLREVELQGMLTYVYGAGLQALHAAASPSTPASSAGMASSCSSSSSLLERLSLVWSYLRPSPANVRDRTPSSAFVCEPAWGQQHFDAALLARAHPNLTELSLHQQGVPQPHRAATHLLGVFKPLLSQLCLLRIHLSRRQCTPAQLDALQAHFATLVADLQLPAGRVPPVLELVG
jgi:hypothetical protein